MNFKGTFYRDYEKLSAENVKLKDRILGYQEKNRELKQSLDRCRKSKEEMKASYEGQLAEKEAVIKELSNRLAHLEAVSRHDGTNTGIPTASTPIGKGKVIPNSRRSSGKKRGGQPGHEKHRLKAFDDDEVTEHVTHNPDDTCPFCGGAMADSGKAVSKDEYDVKINVVKRRHEYHIYQCAVCGAQVRQPIPRGLKEENQYGDNIQALALSLVNTGNVSINKVGTLVAGMTADGIRPSWGYISKLQGRAAKGLGKFMSDLKVAMIQRAILYWDDTVIMVNTARACLRFYGDEAISYYTAHEHKDMESLLEDNILPVLTSDNTVMHDHNKVNYNAAFSFRNIECNQHLQRDLQKNTDDTGHEWSDDLKKLISATIHERKESILSGQHEFQQEYIEKFKKEVRRILDDGWKEHEENPSGIYSKGFEETLLNRINEYGENYFKWVEDFALPTTDNLSERGLRGVKSHMKISGQFENVNTARYFATIKTYIETCRKNGVGELDALSHLSAGIPYTVAEILG